MSIKSIIDQVIDIEGGYVNDPRDSGGETMYGITVAVARAYGYLGDMESLPRSLAYQIYYDEYVVSPGFDKVAELDMDIAEELIDTGVNMGVGVASTFLQRCLNAFNDGGVKYPDLVVDGKVGKASINALRAFLQQRGIEGKGVLLSALNSLQGARYITIAESKPKNERFIYGWIKNRVSV